MTANNIALDAAIAIAMADYQSTSWANWHSMPVRKYDGRRMADAVKSTDCGADAARNRSRIAKNEHVEYWNTLLQSNDAVTLDAIRRAIETAPDMTPKQVKRRDKSSKAHAAYTPVSRDVYNAMTPEQKADYKRAQRSHLTQQTRERKRMGA